MSTTNQHSSNAHSKTSKLCRIFSVALIAWGLGIVSYSPAASADKDKAVTVTVSSKASGGFGTPASGYVPLVKALTVNRAGTITISYLSGTEQVPGFPNGGWSGAVGNPAFSSGPNGVYFGVPGGWATPLQEVIGMLGGEVSNDLALIGAFVPQSVVDTNGFQALDGTKLTSGIGIMPDKLFFVGSYNVIQVSGPGTLFLGINDMIDDDNAGALTVQVTGPAPPGLQ